MNSAEREMDERAAGVVATLEQAGSVRPRDLRRMLAKALLDAYLEGARAMRDRAVSTARRDVLLEHARAERDARGPVSGDGA
jgi:hypothetical protein